MLIYSSIKLFQEMEKKLENWEIFSRHQQEKAEQLQRQLRTPEGPLEYVNASYQFLESLEAVGAVLRRNPPTLKLTLINEDHGTKSMLELSQTDLGNIRQICPTFEARARELRRDYTRLTLPKIHLREWTGKKWGYLTAPEDSLVNLITPDTINRQRVEDDDCYVAVIGPRSRTINFNPDKLYSGFWIRKILERHEDQILRSYYPFGIEGKVAAQLAIQKYFEIMKIPYEDRDQSRAGMN